MDIFIKKIKDRCDAFLKRMFRFGTAPLRQWKRLIVATMMLALALIGLHVYLFYRVETHTVFGVDETATALAPTVDEKKLTSVLNRFEGKALMRESALQIQPAVAEPSR